MSYKITIEEIKSVEFEKTDCWDIVRTVEEADKLGGGQYGYRPPILTSKITETNIYEQVVEDLDIQQVIQAVNGLTAAAQQQRHRMLREMSGD